MFLHPFFLRPFTRRSQSSRVATRAFVTAADPVRIAVDCLPRSPVSIVLTSPVLRVDLVVPTVPTSEP